MESFFVILTTDDIAVANKSCDALERQGVSLLLEHVEVEKDGGELKTGYRLSVPSSKKQLSMHLCSSINNIQ